MKYTVEYTDTFGGEANYSWCHRWEIDAESELSAVRQGKKLACLNGIRGRMDSYGDFNTFRPYGFCTILFINGVY